MSLDSIMNVVIPAALVIGFAAFIWFKFLAPVVLPWWARRQSRQEQAAYEHGQKVIVYE
jgi:hypothetical protein